MAIYGFYVEGSSLLSISTMPAQVLRESGLDAKLVKKKVDLARDLLI